MLTCIISLADALDIEMPELPEEEDVTRVSVVSGAAQPSSADAKVSRPFVLYFTGRRRRRTE